MFDIGWSELVIIGIVALIAIGPKELPGVLRALGHWMGKVRRMASDFQDQFREAMREAEVADLKRQFDEASANAAAGFNNPLESAQKEVEKALGSEPSRTETAPDLGTADPGAIEPSAGIPLAEPASEIPEASTAAPVHIKPDSGKPGGSGAT